MPPAIATVVFALGIAGLFWLNRNREIHTSKALWIPVIWVLIAASRPVSSWLNMTPPTDQPSAYLEGSPIDRFVLAALLTLGLVVLIRRGQQVSNLLKANVPIILFFAYCAISTSWSDFPAVSFKRWIKALGDLVMVLIVLSDVDPAAAIKRLLARTSFLLIPFSMLVIKYYPALGRGYNHYTWTPYYSGVATDKNSLGLLCLVCALGAVWQVYGAPHSEETPRKRRHLIAQGALLAMAVWVLWTANSVTSLSCFVMGTLVLVATRRFKLHRKATAAHILVLVVLLFSFSVVFLDVASVLLEALGRNPTLTGRTDVWTHVIPLNPNPLLGAGYESFWLGERLQKMWSIYWWHPNEAHNGYLEVFLNLGWIGVVLLGALMVTGYRNAFAEFRSSPETGRVKLAYFVAAATYSFSEAGFRELSPIWVSFLLATAAVPALIPAPEVAPEFDLSLADDSANSMSSFGAAASLELQQEYVDEEIT
jgi:exopolysaccharide production protein ExoQ